MIGALLALALFVTGAQASEPLDVVLIVDLNQATAVQLAELPGLGPRRAEAIVELRKKRLFTRVTQLLEVKGIGRKTLERLRPWIRINAPPQSLQTHR